MKDLKILTENFKGTNWQNPRYEDGKLLADHHGELHNQTPGGHTNVYRGTQVCLISPAEKLFTEVFCFDFDQNAFVEQEMDWSLK